MCSSYSMCSFQWTYKCLSLSGPQRDITHSLIIAYKCVSSSRSNKNLIVIYSNYSIGSGSKEAHILIMAESVLLIRVPVIVTPSRWKGRMLGAFSPGRCSAVLCLMCIDPYQTNQNQNSVDCHVGFLHTSCRHNYNVVFFYLRPSLGNHISIIDMEICNF